jgi:hypothetical protein
MIQVAGLLGLGSLAGSLDDVGEVYLVSGSCAGCRTGDRSGSSTARHRHDLCQGERWGLRPSRARGSRTLRVLTSLDPPTPEPGRRRLDLDVNRRGSAGAESTGPLS